MPLTLSLLTEADIPAFAVVDDAAMKDWPFATAMALNSQVPRIQMVEGWVRHGFETDSAQVYLQVSDDETGEMVAGALWRFEDGEGREKQDENVEDKKEGEGDGMKMEEGEDGQAARMAAAFAEARKKMWKEFETGSFLGQPYASELRFFCFICRLYDSLIMVVPTDLLHSKANTIALLRPHDPRHDSRSSPPRSRFAVDRMGNPTCRRTWPQMRSDGFGGWARSISEARFQSRSGGGDGFETLWRGGYRVETVDD
jgi:hypothetical protein